MRGKCGYCRKFGRLYYCGRCDKYLCYPCINRHRCSLGSWFIIIILTLIAVSSVNAGYWKEDITEDFTSIDDWTCTKGTCLTNGSFYGSDANGNIIMRNFSLNHNRDYNITADFWYISSGSNYVAMFFYKEITDAYKHTILPHFTLDTLTLYQDGSSDSNSAYTMNHVTLYRISWIIYTNKTSDVWVNGVLRHTDTSFMNLSKEDDFIGLVVRDNTPTYTEYWDNLVIAYWFNPSMTLNTNLVNNSNVTDYQTHSIPITYNGTITDIETLFNCSFYNNSNLIERDLDVNLSITQSFTLNTSNFTGTYSKLFIDCNNSDGTYLTSGYRYNIDTVFTLTYTEQALTDINDNLIDILEVIKMIGIVILYIGIMSLGYWLMFNFNYVSGMFLMTISLGLDFLITGQLYEMYYDTGSGFGQTMTAIFFYFMFVWIIAKVGSVLSMKSRVTIKRTE